MITVVLVISALVVGIFIGVRRERAKPSIERPVVPTVDEQPVIPEVREALDSLSVGVVVASPSGDIVFRNGMARGLTGAVHSDVLVEEAIDENRVLGIDHGRPGEIVGQHVVVIDDLHATATEDIRRPHQDRIPDARSDAERLVITCRNAMSW